MKINQNQKLWHEGPGRRIINSKTTSSSSGAETQESQSGRHSSGRSGTQEASGEGSGNLITPTLCVLLYLRAVNLLKSFSLTVTATRHKSSLSVCKTVEERPLNTIKTPLTTIQTHFYWTSAAGCSCPTLLPFLVSYPNGS